MRALLPSGAAAATESSTAAALASPAASVTPTSAVHASFVAPAPASWRHRWCRNWRRRERARAGCLLDHRGPRSRILSHGLCAGKGLGDSR